jgi:hypothetical protein
MAGATPGFRFAISVGKTTQITPITQITTITPHHNPQDHQPNQKRKSSAIITRANR